MIASFDDIVADLEFLDAWEDRYGHIIALGKELPKLDDGEKNDLTRVEGCASQVWIVPEIDGDVITFRGESDALIVQGLIAVVLSMYSGKTAAEILAVDAEANFKKLGLDSHLSQQRSNGVRAMIGRIQTLARDRDAT